MLERIVHQTLSRIPLPLSLLQSRKFTTLYYSHCLTKTRRTLIQTVTVQATQLAKTIATDVESTTGTSIILSTETDQYTSTAHSTSTEVNTLTVPVTITPAVVTATSVITVTASSDSTITSFYPTAPAVRAVKSDTEDSEAEDCDLEERAVATSAASKTIPAYASACTNWAQYVVCCIIMLNISLSLE